MDETALFPWEVDEETIILNSRDDTIKRCIEWQIFGDIFDEFDRFVDLILISMRDEAFTIIFEVDLHTSG